ncbi:MAG: hypothetical protein JNL02_00685 [Saprospiraceae bacterium]|nr:hypothetical protein [Saprospiraceae bacterium]
MKKILLIAALTGVLASVATAQNAKYVQAMEKALAGMDTLKTPEEWLARSNSFERIAQKEPGEWLPAYYTAFCQVMVFNMEKDQSKMEPVCAKAELFVHRADSLSPNNSEVYVLLNMVTTLRIRLNPMVNGQKLGPLAGLYLEKAQKLDPGNPRADMQQGLSLYFTPPQWGGDKQKAVELLDSARQKFETYRPASSIHPNWGKEANLRFLEMAKKG